MPLGANGALRLTTARYYTPSNRSIQAKGIKPDIRIEEELPKDLKDKAATMETVSEASLPGHLKNPDDMLTADRKDPKEAWGSPAFVPKDPEKDAPRSCSTRWRSCGELRGGPKRQPIQLERRRRSRNLPRVSSEA